MWQMRFQTMNWTIALIVAAIAAIILVMKRAGQISPKGARRYLKSGALVIDVRSPAEFNSGHLPSAINLPLDEIETVLPRRVKDKKQVLLLHCQSGMRSATAKKRLQGLGYASAFNLGSYGRAAQIVSGK
jgi:phage shock protein E